MKAPYTRSVLNTNFIYFVTLLSLVPILLVQVHIYSWFKLINLFTMFMLAIIIDFIFKRIFNTKSRLQLYSSLIVILILGIILPSHAPIIACLLSTAFALIFGKYVYGGVGQNIFNPAMVGLAFFILSFPEYINFSITSMVDLNFFDAISYKFSTSNNIDIITQATQLSNFKLLYYYDDTDNISEQIALLIGLFILLLTRIIQIYRVVVFLLFYFFITIMILIFKDNVLQVEYALTQVSHFTILFIAIYIITEPVTQPTNIVVAILMLFLIALSIVLFREFTTAIDASAFIILLSNALTPLFDKIAFNFKYGFKG